MVWRIASRLSALALTIAAAFGQHVATVLEVSGNWSHAPGGAAIRQFEPLRAKARLKYEAVAGQPPGKLILADLSGRKYYGVICDPAGKCAGELVIDLPPGSAQPSLFSKMFTAVAQFLTGESGKYVFTISGQADMGDALKDGVAGQSGDSLSVCHLFGGLPPDEYTVNLEPAGQPGSETSSFALASARCPTTPEAKGLRPGVYLMTARSKDLSRTERAYVLVLAAELAGKAQAEFDALTTESEQWLSEDGERADPSTRRRFLVGCLEMMAAKYRTP